MQESNFAPWGHLAIHGEIFGCYTLWGEELALLTSSGWRPGMLLPMVLGTGYSPPSKHHKEIQPERYSALKKREIEVLEHLRITNSGASSFQACDIRDCRGLQRAGD